MINTLLIINCNGDTKIIKHATVAAANHSLNQIHALQTYHLDSTVLFNIIKWMYHAQTYVDRPLGNAIFVLNFLIGGMPWINQITGYVSNELSIMVHLAKRYTILYNGILVNNIIEDNEINISKLNCAVRYKISKMKHARFIRPPPNAMTFYRSMNVASYKTQFESLPYPKVYSHDYDKHIWDNHVIGFQTPLQEWLANNQSLQHIPHDGTLEYHKISVVPKRTFVRHAFIYDSFKPANTLQQKKSNAFKVCIIGAMNHHTHPTILQNVLLQLHNEGISVELHILSRKILCNILPHPYRIIKTAIRGSKYYQYLSTMNVAVNTWQHPVCIYSNSNKLLDCIATNVPMIIPTSPHLLSIVGSYYLFQYQDGIQLKSHLLTILGTPTQTWYTVNIEQYNNTIAQHWHRQLCELQV